MRLIRPSKQEWIAAFIILPLLALTLNFLMFDDRLLHDAAVIKYSVPIVLCIALSSWYWRTIIMHWLRVRFPLFSQTRVRLGLMALPHNVLLSFSPTVI